MAVDLTATTNTCIQNWIIEQSPTEQDKQRFLDRLKNVGYTDERARLRYLLATALDGLAYGNWPWVTH